ncbi:recombinase family protein [Dactylosporangium sp. NPDC049525]|uniref:recombinase family protein n=1 Tax=Dactylosporangium sp. NPDC049525 TaxID=3154730 RepID=UPI0034128E04
MAKIGYARVSTRDQHPESQEDALKAAGCERTFIDRASGKLARRPQLDAALDYLRPGDQLVITRLDRLGRSVKNLCELADDLKSRGVDFQVLSQGIDTSTSAGKFFFHILAGIAEFERDLLSERTLDGLEAARARGRKGGRRPVMTPDKLAVARQMYESKQHTVEAIAKVVGVSRATLYRHLEPGAATAEVDT